MSLNSHLFILLFMPVVLLVYFSVNRTKNMTAGKLVLLGASWVFYCSVNASLLYILLCSILVNWLLGKAVRKQNAYAFYAGIVFNISLLAYLKYSNFFIGAVNAFLHADHDFLNLIQPLGISFFTFENIMYLSDCRHQKMEECSLLDYALYLSCFLYISSGPICSAAEMIPQFNDPDKKAFHADHFARGLILFTAGLAKKTLLADAIGRFVDAGFSDIPSLSSLTAWILIFACGIQLYFDFSGYCDMASGLGKMLNLDLPVNFDSPYQSRTVQEFWRRWHMTLNRFFTRCVYIPLGGNRRGRFRKYCNIMIVFLLSGLWHGANYTFILWGILHGICVVINDAGKKFFARLPEAPAVLLQFIVTDGLFAIFRSDSLTQALQLFHQAVSGGSGIQIDLLGKMIGPEPLFLMRELSISGYEQALPYFVLLFMAVLLWILFGTKNMQKTCSRIPLHAGTAVLTGILLFWSIMSISGVSTFIYNKF